MSTDDQQVPTATSAAPPLSAEHNLRGFEQIQKRYDYDTRTTRLTLKDLPDGTTVKIEVPGFARTVIVLCDLVGIYGPVDPTGGKGPELKFVQEPAIGTRPDLETLVREGRI